MLQSTKELRFSIPLPHTVLGQSLVLLFHSTSHTVQFSPGHQDARQTEISLSKGLPANSAAASKGKGEAKVPCRSPIIHHQKALLAPQAKAATLYSATTSCILGAVTAVAIAPGRPGGTCKASYPARPSTPLPSSKNSAVPARGQRAACSSHFLTARYSGTLFFHHDSTLPKLLSNNDTGCVHNPRQLLGGLAVSIFSAHIQNAETVSL